MKKYLLLFSVSLAAASAGQAQALTAAEQLQATKAIFVADFHKMDDNKDGKLSLEEYLSHQFENFRANIIEAEGFDAAVADKKLPARASAAPADTAADDKGKEPRDELKSLSDVNSALQEMANYELDFDDDFTFDDSFSGLDEEPKKLTREDVMPVADVLSPDKTASDTDLPSSGSSLTKEDAAAPASDTVAPAPDTSVPAPDTVTPASDTPALASDTPAPASAASTKNEASAVSEGAAHSAETDLSVSGEPELPAELDLSVSEDESLKSLLAEINETPEEKAAKKAAAEAEAKAKADAAAAAEQEKNAAVEREKQIGFMLDTIKKTLPKKIDEATTWTDIEYKDKAIAYIYEADIDMAAMSAKEKTALQNSIKTEACGKAYQEMCPRLKPMFINDGINVRIRYLDKGKNELGICEFNHDTCR